MLSFDQFGSITKDSLIGYELYTMDSKRRMSVPKVWRKKMNSADHDYLYVSNSVLSEKYALLVPAYNADILSIYDSHLYTVQVYDKQNRIFLPFEYSKLNQKEYASGDEQATGSIPIHLYGLNKLILASLESIADPVKTLEENPKIFQR